MAGKSRAFAGFATFTSENFNLTGRNDPEQLQAARVSWSFFEVLGVRPALGRTFLPEDDAPGGPGRLPDQPCSLDQTLWRAAGRDRPEHHARCHAIHCRGRAAERFRLRATRPRVDLWAPRVFDLNITTPPAIRAGTSFLSAVARLAPGVSAAQAQAEMDVLDRQYKRENPGMPDAIPSQIMRAQNLRERWEAISPPGTIRPIRRENRPGPAAPETTRTGNLSQAAPGISVRTSNRDGESGADIIVPPRDKWNWDMRSQRSAAQNDPTESLHIRT